MDIQINELKPINGIKVFSVSGGNHEIANMKPILPSRHMIYATQYDDEKEGEIFSQDLRFFTHSMNWYSLVSATDKTVDKIIDTPMAKVLCCRTFFDHLSSLGEGISEVITINASEKNTYILDVDNVYDAVSYTVQAEIGNILTAISLLTLDIYLSNYRKLASEVYYDNSNFKETKHHIERLRGLHAIFGKDLAYIPYV